MASRTGFHEGEAGGTMKEGGEEKGKSRLSGVSSNNQNREGSGDNEKDGRHKED